jgi:phage/conjugal plasmid C-4 type zinc finger TraR family protein
MKSRLIVLLPILWVASLLLTYQFARTNTENAHQAAAVPALVKAIEAHDGKADAGHKADVGHQRRAEKTDATFERINSDLIDYAQSHEDPDPDYCSLDAHGLRLWRAANANTDPGAVESKTGEPGSEVPEAAATTEERPPQGSPGESHRRGEAVPQMRRSPGGFTELGGRDEMSDFTDDSTKTEEEMRRHAIDAQIARAGLRDKTVEDSAEYCAACDYPIPQKRREAVPGVDTCFDCQALLERALKRNARGH